MSIKAEIESCRSHMAAALEREDLNRAIAEKDHLFEIIGKAAKEVNNPQELKKLLPLSLAEAVMIAQHRGHLNEVPFCLDNTEFADYLDTLGKDALSAKFNGALDEVDLITSKIYELGTVCFHFKKMDHFEMCATAMLKIRRGFALLNIVSNTLDRMNDGNK